MDGSGLAWELDVDLDEGDGGNQEPPDSGEGGSGGSGRAQGHRKVLVWPWIALLVGLLAAERAAVLGVIEAGETWIWAFAGLGVVGTAALIAIGGSLFARLR